MDTFVMLLFALIVVVIALVFLSKLLYDKYVKKGGSVTAEGGASTTTTASSVAAAAGSSALLPSGGKDAGAVGLRLSEPKEVLATKKEALLAQARNGALGGGARVGGGLGGGGGGGAAFGPKAGGFGGGAGGGGAALRKRISRKSPGPELTAKKRTIVPPSNINGSDIQSVQWAIHMFRWLYSDLVVVNKLLQDWVGTVNTALLSYVEQHEMIVEVVRILPESLPPNMPSILCEPAEQPNEVELMFDLEATPVLQIKAFKSTNQKTDVSHYKATVSRLKTRMSLIINYFALKGEMKVEGFPDIKIHLNSIGPLKTANAQDEKKQGDLIVELLSSSIRDVVYPIDFSIYSTCPRLMGEEPEEMMPLDYSAYGQYDTYRSYQDDAFSSSVSASPRKLLVKIIKAEGLLQCSQPYCVAEMDEPAQKHQSACKSGPNPFWDDTFLFDLSNSSTELLFEVYDSVAVGNDNADDDDVNAVLNVDPLLDQSAVDDGGDGNDAVTPSNPRLDVVVESADKIVALHDDNTTPTNNNSNDPPTLPCVDDEPSNLDKQPTNDSSSVPDQVVVAETGTVQDDEPGEPAEKAVESDEVDSAKSPAKAKSKCGFQKFLGLGLVGIDELSNGPASTQILELQPRPYETENITGTLTVEFVFIDAPPAPAPRRSHMQQSFRAGEDGLSTSTPKSTLTAVTAGQLTQGQTTGKQLQIASAPTSPAKGGLTSSVSFADRNQRFQAANTNRLNNSFLKPPSVSDYGLNGTNGTRQQSESTPVSPALSSASQTSYNLSASAPESVSKLEKKPTRNIFGTLRNKLTLSKKSKSMDCPEYGGPTYPGGQVHSASSTLSRGSSMDQRSNIFPNIKNLSRKSSISESSAVSGISNASGRTYVHEESTLLLETTENNVVRHYLVPIEVAVRQKSWKRKGTKLHVYNDHTFIAKHIKGGILCHVCHRSILRRPGKQGYECRDCLIQCHKPCHVRAPQACPNPKILSMQLLKWPFPLN